MRKEKSCLNGSMISNLNLFKKLSWTVIYQITGFNYLTGDFYE